MIIEISNVKQFVDDIKRSCDRKVPKNAVFVDDYIKEPCPLIPYDEKKRREQFPKHFSLYNKYAQNVHKIHFASNNIIILPIL